MSDAQERTEKATPRRMKEVRRKGELSTSKDLLAWLGVAAAIAMLPGTLDRAAEAARSQFATAGRIAAHPDAGGALVALGDGLASVGATLLPMFAVVVIAVVGASAAQGGIHVRQLRLHGESLDLVKGFGRVFGKNALWEAGKALLKTAAVGLVVVSVIQGLMPVLQQAAGLSVSALLVTAVNGTATLLWSVVAAGLAVALVDVIVISRRNRKRTMMTKKELHDEAKNTEGDPLVRSQRRARALAMSRNRMIAAVADADVVLVNPTHVAVALRYDPGRSAPRLVAKGTGHVATRIREEAEKHRVPMVRDVPLARALHSACALGQEIPVELYTAVARVLAFVMALKNRGARGGMHTLPVARGGVA